MVKSRENKEVVQELEFPLTIDAFQRLKMAYRNAGEVVVEECNKKEANVQPNS
ncbi:MAG: hypothetical protein KGZ39_05710 [Simkania sp.]|nr:hypothetical protein [Simkania sp.]